MKLNNDIYNSKYVMKYRNKKNEGRLDRLLTYFDLNLNDRVLDVGCGSGFLLDKIGRLVSSYVGIDTSHEFIQESINTHLGYKNAKFLCTTSTIHQMKHRNYYSKIFLMDVTEHLNEHETNDIIKDCYKMLKQNGQLFIHTPNAQYLLEILKKYGLLKQTTGHISVKSYSTYKHLLNKYGFKKIKIYYLNHYLSIMKFIDKLRYLPVTGKYFQARLFIIAEK